ncbi:hypothetical protein KKC45_03945 [Patescibacteria group bacterium]|nr:hypothetical protein [Patescibacteria group bacterium]
MKNQVDRKKGLKNTLIAGLICLMGGIFLTIIFNFLGAIDTGFIQWMNLTVSQLKIWQLFLLSPISVVFGLGILFLTLRILSYILGGNARKKFWRF